MSDGSFSLVKEIPSDDPKALKIQYVGNLAGDKWELNNVTGESYNPLSKQLPDETKSNSSVVRPFRSGADHRSADVLQRPVSNARSDASVLGQSPNLASQYVDGNLARQPEAVDLVESVTTGRPQPLRIVPAGEGKPARAKAAKAIKPSGKKAQPKDVNDLTAILPEVPSGFWWEVASNAKGYKIDLRWRVQGKKTGQTFQRLGKHEYQSLMEETHATRCQLIADRLISELRADQRPERRQIAERLRAKTAHD